MQVLIQRLNFDYNLAGARSMAALSEYVWNCPEPIQEINVAHNEVAIPGQGSDDPISALIRCLYNHRQYPVRNMTASGLLVTPLVLRVSGNRLAGIQMLLS